MTVEVINYETYSKFKFKSDPNFDRLRLIVILSPIFIASFDNGIGELDYLKDTINLSKFPYGLYPSFFDNFDIDTYQQTYTGYDRIEDIYLNEDDEVEFIVNKLDEPYLKSLKALIEGLILDNQALSYWLDYFSLIRDDIVINGRRSILANGIQAFYLSRYVVVWMIDLCTYVSNHRPDKALDIEPIYELAINLKTPRNLTPGANIDSI